MLKTHLFFSGIKIFALFYSFVKYIGGWFIGICSWYLGERKYNYVWIGLASSLYSLCVVGDTIRQVWKMEKKEEKKPRGIGRSKKKICQISLFIMICQHGWAIFIWDQMTIIYIHYIWVGMHIYYYSIQMFISVFTIYITYRWIHYYIFLIWIN